MLAKLLSQDLPRSRLLSAILLLIVIGLLATPFIFPGARSLNVGAKIAVFIVLAASFDLLLGYTGIVSFAHTMFFGIGAYGIGIASTQMGPTWTAMAAGLVAAVTLSTVLALGISLFSLRVRAIFFAMITLAVAAAFMTMASQLSDWTGGEDGLNFKVPELISPAFSLSDEKFLGASLNGKLIAYYLVVLASGGLFLLMLRIVNSPFGRVLMAIRDNDFRSEAIGYRNVTYRSLSSVLAALFATLAGVLYALWLRYNGPGTTLSFDIMIDVLLIVVIGGMGTLYGAVVGSALFNIAQGYLQDLLKLAHGSIDSVPVIGALFHPDRWLFWLGLLFVLSVYFFPFGIVGKLRAGAQAKPGGSA